MQASLQGRNNTSVNYGVATVPCVEDLFAATKRNDSQPPELNRKDAKRRKLNIEAREVKNYIL